jgi:cytochrome c biogenesis protein CcmG, thiol:disulfide interchange protein DsbE
MTENPIKRNKPVAKIWGLFFLGIGLILAGIAVGLILIPKVASSQEQKDSQNSVVPVKVNFSAPELALKDVTGQPSALKDYQGQIILVNNWATWCPPCKAEMPALEEFYTHHKDQGFVLVAVEAGEPVEEVAQFVKDYSLTFPVWLDPQNKSIRVFKNYNLPNSYVIDRDGVVRFAWTGGISLKNLEKYITPLLED